MYEKFFLKFCQFLIHIFSESKTSKSFSYLNMCYFLWWKRQDLRKTVYPAKLGGVFVDGERTFSHIRKEKAELSQLVIPLKREPS